MPKQDSVPAFDSTTIKIRHIDIDDEDPLYSSYDEDEITEEIVTKILREILQGLNIYLYLDPNGEVDVFEVIYDREWLAIGLSLHVGTKEEKNYYCYNPDFAIKNDMNYSIMHIKYAELKFCPLIILSVCPECRCKFLKWLEIFQLKKLSKLKVQMRRQYSL